MGFFLFFFFVLLSLLGMGYFVQERLSPRRGVSRTSAGCSRLWEVTVRLAAMEVVRIRVFAMSFSLLLSRLPDRESID